MILTDTATGAMPHPCSAGSLGLYISVLIRMNYKENVINDALHFGLKLTDAILYIFHRYTSIEKSSSPVATGALVVAEYEAQV